LDFFRILRLHFNRRSIEDGEDLVKLAIDGLNFTLQTWTNWRGSSGTPSGPVITVLEPTKGWSTIKPS
jgi:hypothetical protein